MNPIFKKPSTVPLVDVRGDIAIGAQCRFDPELHTGPNASETPDERAAREEVAVEVCGMCPLRLACLAYAIDTQPDYGVWGGHTVAQIRALAGTFIDDLGEVA
ncbi:WhiB family transcriptional regulator [Actinomadura atramentaria]|uniref:WhiB family transcriptional regulator n=1 Tax=Actinomadura atramentaria TaxID=1990 RepID=UPI0003A0CEA5|nr:WhiB family transcriptional regulator [Actinomadura atramentaria]